MFALLGFLSAIMGIFGIIEESLALILTTTFFGARFIAHMARYN